MNIKIKKTIMMIVMAMALIGCFSVVNASQVSAKTVRATTNYKKAKKIKKGTHTIIVNSNYSGKMSYVKFKAPKTKKYTFTISNMVTNGTKTDGKDIQSGHVQFAHHDRYGMSNKKVKTQGGKDYALYICTQDSWNVSPNFNGVYSELPSRSTTFKMKKGETIYISSWFTAPQTSFVINIK